MISAVEGVQPQIIAMGSVPGIGTSAAGFTEFGAGDARFARRLTDLVTRHDDELLAAWVSDKKAVPYRRLRRALAWQSRAGLVRPVFFGSAITGAGTEQLTDGIAELLPAVPPSPGGQPSGTVFKIERGDHGEKIAYVRMFAGTLRARDRVTSGGRDKAKITAISVFDGGAAVPRESVSAGLLSLYGEVQKEVIQATLAHEFGVEIGFRDTITICAERPVGTGAAMEETKGDGNPFLAKVGLRVEQAQAGAGVRFGYEIELGALPYSFFKAIEETVSDVLAQGLCGWQVLDVAVTLTHSGYWPRQSHLHGTLDKSMSSTAGDFRNLAPLVLMAALAEAGTVVCEPRPGPATRDPS